MPGILENDDNVPNPSIAPAGEPIVPPPAYVVTNIELVFILRTFPFE